MYASNTTEVWCAPPYLHPYPLSLPFPSSYFSQPPLLFCPRLHLPLSSQPTPTYLYFSVSPFAYAISLSHTFPIYPFPFPRGTNSTGPQITGSWVRVRSTPVDTRHSCSDYWLAQFRLICAYTIIPLHPPPANPPLSIYSHTSCTLPKK